MVKLINFPPPNPVIRFASLLDRGTPPQKGNGKVYNINQLLSLAAATDRLADWTWFLL